MRLTNPLRILTACTLCLASAWSATGGWKFSWSDEFDRTGSPIVPGTWKWDGKESLVRDATLDTNNGWCANGLLVLEARRVGTQNKYTTAAISSIKLKSWKYGRFEMRGKIDIRKGSWPAWWGTGVAGGWPTSGEIDMMEYYSDKALFNVMDGKKGWSSPTLSVKALGGDYWSSQFHTWIMEWDSTRIDLSLDGRLVNHYVVSKADGTGPNGTNPFKQPYIQELNQAIGQAGGDPSQTQFPMRFEVDYVRHWQWVDSSAFTLTVQGGTGSGQYLPGTRVSITAEMPPVGKSFDKWVVTSGNPGVEAGTNAAASFSMPSYNVVLTATYKVGVSVMPRNARANVLGKPFAADPGFWYDISGRHLGQAVPGRVLFIGKP
ncbi:MAG TPA: family 16 glycosylhydrolase [Fibrobacteria bacterium]|nr:family 16 glycosylhydrolase [Fibrobacteria bacterium]